MTALRDVARASRQAKRGRPGESRVPTMWAGRVYRVRYEGTEAGVEPGLYITVPRLTGDEIHGPVPTLEGMGVVEEGDSILVAALEGRTELLLVMGRIVWAPPGPGDAE